MFKIFNKKLCICNFLNFLLWDKQILSIYLGLVKKSND